MNRDEQTPQDDETPRDDQMPEDDQVRPEAQPTVFLDMPDGDEGPAPDPHDGPSGDDGTSDADVEGFLQRPRLDVDPDTLAAAVAGTVGTDADPGLDTDGDGHVSPREARDRRLMAQRTAGATVITREQRTFQDRRTVIGGAAALIAAAYGWGWIQSQPEGDNIPFLLRNVFELNDRILSATIEPFGDVREFDIADATPIRTNGGLGLDDPVDPSTWTLHVIGLDGEEIETLTIDDVSTDQVAGVACVDKVYEHKCVEGWANITHWRGAPFNEIAAARWPDQMEAPYVAFITPDEEYYVGLDMDSAMHPQTLLTSALDGEALPDEHGGPLRLTAPLHYGIKSLKRIGTIRFMTQRPGDYWAERGYDWHSTH